MDKKIDKQNNMLHSNVSNDVVIEQHRQTSLTLKTTTTSLSESSLIKTSSSRTSSSHTGSESSISSTSCNDISIDFDEDYQSFCVQVSSIENKYLSSMTNVFKEAHKHRNNDFIIKEKEVILHLKSKILNLCNSFCKGMSQEDNNYQIVVKHSRRFLTKLKFNHVWNLSILEKEYLSDHRFKVTYSNTKKICICPCSQMMNKWHKQYLSKKDDWVCHYSHLPCKSKNVSLDDFVQHVCLYKDDDIFHRITYEYMKQMFPSIDFIRKNNMNE